MLSNPFSYLLKHQNSALSESLSSKMESVETSHKQLMVHDQQQEEKKEKEKCRDSKQVRFVPFITVRDIGDINHYSETEVSLLWYTRQELKCMKREHAMNLQEFLSLDNQSVAADKNSNIITTNLGLERDPWIRHQNRRRVQQVVLRLQCHQAKIGVSNPTAISLISRAATQACQQAAHDLALQLYSDIVSIEGDGALSKRSNSDSDSDSGSSGRRTRTRYRMESIRSLLLLKREVS